MKYQGCSVSDINIAYIGGGSREWAWELMNDLALEGQLSGNIRLYDINFEAAYDNEIIGNSLAGYDNAAGIWNYKAVATLEEALTGADFVVISILPGTFKEMESDVHAPEKYGIYQSVGDSTGPGGILRALRTIPMYVEIAEAIKKCSPAAWVINYTNPMSLCTKTLYQVYPDIKAFGCCHEVFGAQHLFVKMLKDIKGLEGISREEIKLNVLGINHFTWISRAMYLGTDLFPAFKEFSEKYADTGFERPSESDANAYFKSGHRVQFDLFMRYGVITASGDRHTAEFCPPWYLRNPETVMEWQFSLTPVSYRKEDLKKKYNRGKRLVRGEEKFRLVPSEEEGVRQIKALLGLGDFVTNVNLPNIGQQKGLPYGCIVETNAAFSRNSIVPLYSGQLPDDVNSLILRQVCNQEAVLKAGLLKNKELAFRAFANDPLVTLSINDARRLFSEMLENTAAYLPGWDI